MAIQTVSLSKGAKVRISKSGKIMVVHNGINIRTNLTSMPDYVATVEYDDTQVTEYNGGRYVNGELTLGTNALYSDKLAAIKEAGLTVNI